jgi:hypothetical protein
MGWVAAALLFLATIAAIIGAWTAHFDQAGNVVFGSTPSSLSLLALSVSSALWLKIMRCCCPCSAEK